MIALIASLIVLPTWAEATSTDVLSRVRDSGTLRLGVTGDYMPFSEKNLNDNTYVGIGHDLAEVIASQLDVKVEIVDTSWPTLMNDLLSNKYGIAMTGVSKNAGRLKTAYFSNTYFEYGKTPVTLCENVSKYNSLEKIDLEQVTLVINEGGTNAAFARETMANAKLHVEETNRYVYDRILDGTVDLMITDSVEADYRALHTEQLCRSMPDTILTQSNIGAMMPKDDQFRDVINQIIDDLIKSGEMEKIIERNMNIKV